MAASGGCIRMQQLEQPALLEQMIVEGALCSKASCVVLVEASRAAGERERESDEVAGRTAEEALSAGCMKGATVDWRCCFGINNGLASRSISHRSPRAALNLTLSGQRRNRRYRA